MNKLHFTPEQFRVSAIEKLSFLEKRGFGRAADAEYTSSTGSSVVYLGKRHGFVFTFDVKDQCVDAQIVQVKNGHMKWNWEGGYSSDIYTYLVKCCGYRGKVSHSGDSDESQLDRMLNGWVDLLLGAGNHLLNEPHAPTKAQ